MSRYEKLTNQPLVMALAEFRFSTILTMNTFVSSFQNHLRQDFPHFKTTDIQEMAVSEKGVNITTHEGWLFLSSNRKRAIRLHKDRITFMTSEYDRFPDFLKDCKAALSFIEKKIKPSFIERVGLRYTDLIIAENENEAIESYVDQLICNAGQLSRIGDQVHRGNETVLKTDVGLMVVRSLYGNLNLSAWPDLSDPPIVIEKYSEPSKRILLDFDHFWLSGEESVKFEVDFIVKKLNDLHEKSREAFWEITTHASREVWK